MKNVKEICLKLNKETIHDISIGESISLIVNNKKYSGLVIGLQSEEQN